jgi:preprotein translocase subunit YajC
MLMMVVMMMMMRRRRRRIKMANNLYSDTAANE